MNYFLPRAQVGLFLFFCLLGCSTNKDKPQKLTSLDATTQVKQVWERNTGKLNAYYHQFQLAQNDEAIFTPSLQGKVSKINKQSGKLLWSKQLKQPLSAGVTLGSEKLYLGLMNGQLVALNSQQGDLLWSTQLSSETVAPPVYEGGYLIVHVNDGSVYRLNPDTGAFVWKYESSMPPLTLRGASKPKVFDRFVAVGFANGTMGIIDAETGQLRWQNRVSTPKGDSEIERLVDIKAQPLISGKLLLAVGYQGQLAAYDIQSGQKKWTQKTSSYQDMLIVGDQLIIAESDANIKAVDINSGTISWQQDALKNRGISAITEFDEQLLVSDMQGIVHVLSVLNGGMIGRKSVTLAPRSLVGHDKLVQIHRLMKKKPGIRVTALSDEQRFYLLADDGNLSAFRLKQQD